MLVDTNLKGIDKKIKYLIWELRFDADFGYCPLCVTMVYSMAHCKTAVSPLLTHWRYCSLATSHRTVASMNCLPSSNHLDEGFHIHNSKLFCLENIIVQLGFSDVKYCCKQLRVSLFWGVEAAVKWQVSLRLLANRERASMSLGLWWERKGVLQGRHWIIIKAVCLSNWVIADRVMQNCGHKRAKKLQERPSDIEVLTM